MRFKTEEGDYVEKSVDASTTSIVLTSGPSAMLNPGAHDSCKAVNPENSCLAQEIPDSLPSSFDSVVFTKQSGLIPLATSSFEVRASNNYSAGEWTRVSAYIGIQMECNVVHCYPVLDEYFPPRSYIVKFHCAW